MKRKIHLLIALLAVCFFPKDYFGQTLGTAGDFALFSRVGAVSNVGANTHITGHVGTNSGSSTGFGNVNGQMHDNDAESAQASTDVLALYNELNGMTPAFFPAPLLGNGQILVPGVYSIAGPASLSLDLILDAQGDPNAVFVIQVGGALSTQANSSVKLINGARAMHVFWKIEGLVDMASGTVMKGTVVSNNSAITINSGSELEGRALTTTGALTITNSLVYVPTIGAPVLTGPAAPAMGTTACYAIFSADGPVTNSGVTYVVGDIGTNNGLTTGYNPLFVTGTIHPVPDVSTGACAADLMIVYTYLEGLAYDIELLYPAQFGNDLVLTPHTYLMSSAVNLIDTLYLDALGNSSAVFVIRTDGAFSTAINSRVILLNGAQSGNVFWEVDGAVDINDNSIFVGTIVANNAAVDLSAGVTLNGRAFTTTGGVITTAVMVTMPVGCGAAAPDITSISTSEVVCEGDAASFSVTATGTNLTYQWRKGNLNMIDNARVSGSNTNTLTIDPTILLDEGNDYYVVVYGTYSPNDTSSMFSLSIETAPVITSHPADRVLCAGETAVFSVSADGDGQTYQWRRGATPIVDDANFSGAQSATLTISNVNATHIGTDYNVVVTGTCPPAATSNNAELRFNAIPVVTTQPVDRIACDGSAISFTAAANGDDLTYQWKNGAADMVDGPTVSGAQTTILTLDPINSTDAGTDYHLVITNCAGSVSSNNASLSVNTSPVITTEPTDKVICSGDSTGFVVVATGTNLSYQWRRGVVNLIDDGTITGSNTDTLSIDPVNGTHQGGNYNVVITGTCTPPQTSVNVSLTVNTDSDIVVQPVTQTVCEGATVSFSVTATGTGETYQWRKGNADVVDGPTISGSQTNTLTFNPATLADASNDYYVVIDACSPNDTSAHIALVVNTAPIITLEPIAQTACAGDSVSFVVAAAGSGLSYQWYRGAVPVVNTASISGAGNDTLTFEPVSLADAGNNYNVIVSGACAPADQSVSVALVVNTAPNIVTQPTGETVCEGSAVSFSVVATGNGLTYQWVQGTTHLVDNGTFTGSTTPTLSISPVSLADSGAYYVIVGACAPNDTSDVITLTVYPIPVATAGSNSPVCIGRPIELSAATLPGASYSWTGPLAYTSVEQNPVIPIATAARAGDYELTVTVNGCASAPSTTTVVVTTDCETDLSVNKTVNNATPLVGEQVIFMIVVSNEGPNHATGVVVTDQLQGGYSYSYSSATTGFYNPATSLWTIGDLDNGDSDTLWITVKVNRSGNYTNTATVSGNETDPEASNDVSTSETNPTEFRVPEGFSPNGDGINDLYVVTGISNYPYNTLKVFNRWGDEVLNEGNYQNNWNGTSSKGGMGTEELPVGTYFYVLDLGDGSEVLKGTIYINR